MSGPYADVGGAGSVWRANGDRGFRPAAKGWTIDIVSADHQNKVDIGSNIARQWFDQGKADVILDALNSGVALAVSQIVKEKNKVFLVSGAGNLGPDRQGLHAEHDPLDL